MKTLKKSPQKKIPPKLCFTVSGCLIVEDRILLVKHRKAGVWLTPGGHLEPNELPHQGAEREFLEETGISVKVSHRGFFPEHQTAECTFLALPFVCNVHWVSYENYEARITSSAPDVRTTSGTWDKGCEQHFHMNFLLDLSQKSLVHHMDPKESLDIRWFSLEEITDLDTTEDIRSEIQYAFQLLKK
jgi:8-oxo-dGTP pyrophosphatase MutT (NUDIX family)